MDDRALSQSLGVEKGTVKSVSSVADLLVEPLVDGTALIFDRNTGATTLINERALILLNLLRSSGVVSESTFSSMAATAFPVASEFSDILISLEKSKLVIRC